MAGPRTSRVGLSTGASPVFYRKSTGASSPATQNHRLYVKRVSVNRKKISTRRTRRRHGGSRRKRVGFAGGEAEESREARPCREASFGSTPQWTPCLSPWLRVETSDKAVN